MNAAIAIPTDITPAQFGRWAVVAIRLAVANNNDGEALHAYWMARWAAHVAIRSLSLTRRKRSFAGSGVRHGTKNPHAAALGKLGGAVTSPAKTAACRENGKKGGWPKGKPRKPKS